jgi:DNA-binding NtrC family response regulator
MVFEEEDLPADLRADSPSRAAEGGDLLAVACETFERNFLEQALDRSGWNKAACARMLGISYATMKNKIAKYGIADPFGVRRERAGSGLRPERGRK